MLPPTVSAPVVLGPVAAPHQLPGVDCCRDWLFKKDVALLPTMQLPVTLVVPAASMSLNTPPPLVAVLFGMRLPVTVVLPHDLL